jgi:hypothetical protein
VDCLPVGGLDDEDLSGVGVGEYFFGGTMFTIFELGL